MISRLGNTVLRSIKKVKQTQREHGREAWRREMIESMITEFFGILARAANAENNKLTHAIRSGELSRQAKKELAIKLENASGYDWER
jgi:hypothetical protein